MKKLIKLIMAIAAVIFLVACGGGSDTSGTPNTYYDPIMDKDGILIYHNYPSSVCLSPGLRQRLITTTGDHSIIVRSENNNIHCSDYNRVNDHLTCREGTFSYQYNDACVVGFDVPLTYGKVTSGEDTSNDNNLILKQEKIIEILVSSN